MTAVQAYSAGQGDLLLQTLPQVVKAVSTWIGCELDIKVPEPAAPSGGTDLVICLPLTGEVNGSLVLAFSAAAGCFLATRMLGHEQTLPLSRLGLSALQELGNILASGLVMACEEQLALSCQLHPPHTMTSVPTNVNETVVISVWPETNEEMHHIKVYWSMTD